VTRRTGAYSRDTDLTGLWSGEYWYAGMSFPTPFTAHLIDQQGDLSGTTLEPRTFGVGDPPELSAEITGARGDLDVRFTKLYDPAPGVHRHPIYYTGVVDPKFTLIEGEWRFNIPNDVEGRFVLMRVLRGVEAVAAETGAVVRVKR
jgi:hypothetical protein